MKNEFESKLSEIKKKFDDDLSANRADMIAKLKRDYGEIDSMDQISTNISYEFFNSAETQYIKFKQEKEEEQQDMQRMYKRKLVDADVKTR